MLEPLFNKVASLSVNTAKILRIHIFTKHLRWLLPSFYLNDMLKAGSFAKKDPVKNPLNTERKLDVQNTSTSHSRRLLNASGTFNLRSVSRGCVLLELFGTLPELRFCIRLSASSGNFKETPRKCLLRGHKRDPGLTQSYPIYTFSGVSDAPLGVPI